MKTFIICLLLANAIFASKDFRKKTGKGIKHTKLVSVAPEEIHSWDNYRYGGRKYGMMTKSEFDHSLKPLGIIYTAGCFYYDFTSNACAYCGEGTFLHNNYCFYCNNNKNFKGSCYYNSKASTDETLELASQWNHNKKGLPVLIVDEVDDKDGHINHNGLAEWGKINKDGVIIDACINSADDVSLHNKDTSGDLNNGMNWHWILDNFNDKEKLAQTSFEFDPTEGTCKINAEKHKTGCQVFRKGESKCSECWFGYLQNSTGICYKNEDDKKADEANRYSSSERSQDTANHITEKKECLFAFYYWPSYNEKTHVTECVREL